MSQVPAGSRPYTHAIKDISYVIAGLDCDIWEGLQTMMQYVVQRGDTLSLIAARFGTSVEAIVRANGIKNPSMICKGQILYIPTSNYGHKKKYYHDNNNDNNNDHYKYHHYKYHKYYYKHDDNNDHHKCHKCYHKHDDNNDDHKYHKYYYKHDD